MGHEIYAYTGLKNKSETPSNHFKPVNLGENFTRRIFNRSLNGQRSIMLNERGKHEKWLNCSNINIPIPTLIIIMQL